MPSVFVIETSEYTITGQADQTPDEGAIAGGTGNIGSGPFTLVTDSDPQLTELTVTDTNNVFQEQARPSGTNPTGNQFVDFGTPGLTINGVTYTGQVPIAPQYVMSATVNGETSFIYGVSLPADNVNGGGEVVDVLVWAGAPPEPNTTYNFTEFGDQRTVAPAYETLAVCFAAGSLLQTPDGPIAVEDLAVGDLVTTLDAGDQPVRWIGSKRLSALALAQKPKLRPIRLRAGCLGPNVPSADLSVSPQHRILVRNAVAQRMFGKAEVLVPAVKLLDLPGVEVDEEVDEVVYFHILFGDHQIVSANGALTESLYTGAEALRALGPEAVEEISTLFPELVQRDTPPRFARMVPAKGQTIKSLVSRSVKNGHAIQARAS